MRAIWKECLAPGCYQTRRGVFRCTPSDIERYHARNKRMLAAGIECPIPLEHQAGAVPLSAAERAANTVRFNSGWVKDWRIRDGALEALMEVDDELGDKLATHIKYVSPEIDHFVSGDGVDFGRCITHVCLTTRPVAHRQRPFGSDGAQTPAPLPRRVIKLSHVADGPVQLSMATRIVQSNGKWVPADPPAYQLAWTAFQSRKTAKNPEGIAARNERGHKVYGKRAEQAMASQGKKPAARPAAPAKPAKSAPSKPAATRTTGAKAAAVLKDFTEALNSPKTPKAGDDFQPAAKGAKAPKGGYSKEVSALTVPALKGVAQKHGLDKYHGELVLGPAAIANARKTYTTWSRKAGNPAALAEKLEAAIAADRKAMDKGKTHTAAGQPYAGRMLAFRHMLTWAEADHAAKGDGDAIDFVRRLNSVPAAERLKHAEENNFLQTAAHEIALSPLESQEDGAQQYREIVSSGRRDMEDVKFMRTYLAQVLERVRKGQHDELKLNSILRSLSDNGIGTLAPDELRKLASSKKQLSFQLSTKGPSTMNTENGNLFGADVDDEDDTENEAPASLDEFQLGELAAMLSQQLGVDLGDARGCDEICAALYQQMVTSQGGKDELEILDDAEARPTEEPSMGAMLSMLSGKSATAFPKKKQRDPLRKTGLEPCAVAVRLAHGNKVQLSHGGETDTPLTTEQLIARLSS